MYREEWPSERKLERLREEGKLPYSSFAVAALVLLAIGIWLAAAASSEWRLLLARAAELSAHWGDKRAAKALCEAALLLLLAPAGAASIAVIAGGLAQTRFLLRPALAGIKPERVSPMKPLSLARTALRALNALALLVLFSIASLAAARLLAPGAAGMLIGDPAETIWWPYRLLRMLAPFVLTAVGAAAFAAALLARLRFMLQHRMSREELEAETREG